MNQYGVSLADPNFNSIKVQLKRHQKWNDGSVRKFQFHKGTIKADDIIESADGVPIFQFHKGTIKALFRCRALRAFAAFQFHKGTIKASQQMAARTL